MAELEQMPLFPDIQANDPTYLSFMDTLRADMSSVVASRCTAFSFNFLKDQPLESETQSAFQWEIVKTEGDGAPGDFSVAGRVSVASLDTMSTFPTFEMDSETQIPEICFSSFGRTSLTNEEFVNELPEQIPEDPEEEEEGATHHMPYQSSSTTGGLPFGR
jgi:hypothetical protein